VFEKIRQAHLTVPDVLTETQVRRDVDAFRSRSAVSTRVDTGQAPGALLVIVVPVTVHGRWWVVGEYNVNEEVRRRR